MAISLDGGPSEELVEHDYSSASESDDEALNESRQESSNAHETMLQEREMVKKTVLEETHKVQLWRRNVVIVMVLTGALVTTLIYLFLKSIDQDAFEDSVST